MDIKNQFKKLFYQEFIFPSNMTALDLIANFAVRSRFDRSSLSLYLNSNGYKYVIAKNLNAQTGDEGSFVFYDQTAVVYILPHDDKISYPEYVAIEEEFLLGMCEIHTRYVRGYILQVCAFPHLTQNQMIIAGGLSFIEGVK